MNYRLAIYDDYEKIARLHARSWRENYRGIWLDSYLDGSNIIEERISVWKSRLEFPTENQYIIVAEENRVISGFACAFANEDTIWGTLLDNLHVLSEKKGQGIGKKLMQDIAHWIKNKELTTPVHLWVLEKNYSARKFYDAMGGVQAESLIEENPGGGEAEILRYVWRDIEVILGK